MNLVINGAESSGDSAGCVTVRTGVAEIGPSDILGTHAGDAAPGKFVYLEVRDNGSGMDEATRNKIFDPFFTTKFLGRGLGLSAVLGIVRRHNGLLRLDSSPGAGTTFQVLFPALDQPALALEATPLPRIPDGSGCVLAVDDEEILRNTVKACLEHYGYEVVLANDGLEAVELIRNNRHAIDLALIDLAMPGMNGAEALREIHALRPGLPAILTSGYDESKLIELSRDLAHTHFIQKPYTPEQLAEKVNAVLSKARAEPFLSKKSHARD